MLASTTTCSCHLGAGQRGMRRQPGTLEKNIAAIITVPASPVTTSPMPVAGIAEATATITTMLAM